MKHTWISTLFCMWALWASDQLVTWTCMIDGSCVSGPHYVEKMRAKEFYETRADCEKVKKEIDEEYLVRGTMALMEAKEKGLSEYSFMKLSEGPKCFPVGHNPNWELQR